MKSAATYRLPEPQESLQPGDDRAVILLRPAADTGHGANTTKPSDGLPAGVLRGVIHPWRIMIYVDSIPQGKRCPLIAGGGRGSVWLDTASGRLFLSWVTDTGSTRDKRVQPTGENVPSLGLFTQRPLSEAKLPPPPKKFLPYPKEKGPLPCSSPSKPPGGEERI